MTPGPRSRAQRQADTLALLSNEVDCWIGSADEVGNTHLVPLSHYWDCIALAARPDRRASFCENF